jgi:uncharacterized damage-inducible protein DinB
MNSDIRQQIIGDIAFVFQQQRQLAEGAASQLTDEEFFRNVGSESNSVAVLIKHVGGNLRSRWTDFLTSDGEKPDRNRDGEFITDGETRKDVMNVWERGFSALDGALGALRGSELDTTVYIRGEPCTVAQALARNVTHVAHHSGQIVFLSKLISGPRWKTLSIPRGASQQVLGNFWTGPR